MDIPAYRFDAFSLDAPSLSSLLPLVLPHFLPLQRWYGARSTPISGVSVRDVVPLPGLQETAARVLVEIGGAQPPRLYQLLLGLAQSPSAALHSTLARLELPERIQYLVELLGSAQDCETVVHCLFRQGHNTQFSAGLGPSSLPLRARPLEGEQTHSSVILGEQAIVKFFRRLEPDPNPELEITQLLTNVGFLQTPHLLGWMTYELGKDESMTLAVVHEYVPNNGDGWKATREALRAYLASPSIQELETAAAQSFALGATTGRLHQAFVETRDRPAFAPELLRKRDLEEWFAQTLDSLVAVARELREEVSEREFLLAKELLAKLPNLVPLGLKHRIHGDYHLGQVLQAADRWVVFDFEGEPSRSLSARRSKYSPLRDIAGMLRSFDYATMSVLRESESTAGPQLESQAQAWHSHQREAFLKGWLAAVRGTSLYPADERSFWLLLQGFELDKAVYELGYELAHRPAWVSIPLQGFRRILSRPRV